MTLGAYFGADVDGVVTRLLADQLDDGGWNCWTEYGSTVSSFALDDLRARGPARVRADTGGSAELSAARRRGEQYLLERSLFRRKSTGEVPVDAWLQFSFPPRWHYDVLRALEYFRLADVPDPRLADAVELVRSKRQRDGTWLLENTHPGAVHFELEDGDGHPSRWNTLRATRVLGWWDRSGSAKPSADRRQENGGRGDGEPLTCGLCSPGRNRTYVACPDSKSGGPCQQTNRGTSPGDAHRVVEQGPSPDTRHEPPRERQSCGRTSRPRASRASGA